MVIEVESNEIQKAICVVAIRRLSTAGGAILFYGNPSR